MCIQSAYFSQMNTIQTLLTEVKSVIYKRYLRAATQNSESRSELAVIQRQL